MDDISESSVPEKKLEDHPWDDERFVKEMIRRTNELESGKVKGYSWAEVKEITRKKLSELRK